MSKQTDRYLDLGNDALEARLICHLPEPLRQIGEIAGLQPAVAIAEAKGGVLVWFPNGKGFLANKSSWLLDFVDEEIAWRICDDIFPMGENVMIPMVPFIVRIVRVKELTLAGMSIAKIAQRLRCHRRSVVRARAWLISEGQLQRIDHAAPPEAASDY
ncbi:hypothetical protein [Methylosinus sp. KRF6]|uniref:hypothetical protein n=1 Tax=Methylosinus sp. KRF6 TaxID=2846853 RepID=UPI001C0C1CEE|nr:hypothetical protein [Methylosinus sp. KRF6]MBU3889854.1 hypothetical protein [Methylosinus sp. KRF6]